MARDLTSRRLIKLARQIDEREFAWSPHFDNRPDETANAPWAFFEIIEDIYDWLRKDDVARYATESSGSDYFQKAWKSEEQFKKALEHFKTLQEFGFVDGVKFGLDLSDPDYTKNSIAETEHFLDCFRHALQHQLECATAARAYAQTVSKEHHNEFVPFVPLDAKQLEEALDLHLVDIGKYDPLLKHHIHAAAHTAVNVPGYTPVDAMEATFDAAQFDRYFAKLQSHLRNNINTIGEMTKVLSTYREHIDEAFQSTSHRER